MKKEIVVARYKEDISWISKIENQGYDITVYNKYEGENLLPNVGRESHTYLTHIFKNYDNLADFTIFVQGNPFDHSPNFLNELNDTNPQVDLTFYGTTSKPNGQIGFINCDVNGQPHGTINDKFIPVGKFWEWLTLTKSPQIFVSIAGAQFGVSKRNIKRFSKHFYERAIGSLNYDNSPIEGNCFERLWGMLFGLKTKDISYNNLIYSNDPNLNFENYIKMFLDKENNEIKCAGELGFKDV